MLRWTLRHDYLRQLWLLVLALASGTLVFGEDLPKNELRILSMPAFNEPPAAELEPPADAIPLVANDKSVKKPTSDPEMLLVSDGWQARQSDDEPVQMTAPASSPAPSKAIIETDPKAQSNPTSTLKFLSTDASKVQTIAPELQRNPVKTATAPAPETLYGPGTPPQRRLKVTSEKLKRDEANELPDPNATPIVNPEQNEPAVEKRVTVKNDAGSSEPELVEVPFEEPDEVIEGRTDDTAKADAAPVPQRVQVRDLKLRVDGTVVPPTSSRGTPAAPISKRLDTRQSIGDEPSEIPVAENVSGDRIGPKGELILAIGMSDPQARVTSTAARLRVPIERTLNYYWTKPEDAEERTHWGMFHAMMIYDKDTQIISEKRRYNAVAWMAGNNACRNQLLLEQDNRGINVKTGIGLQGHQAQMLAVLGLIDVPAAYPLYVGRNKFTVNDVIRREMLACKSGDELTFTLIGLSHYVDSDTQWVSDDGQDWDFERLIQEELSQPIVGAACGGTHRLMGFAHSLRRRRAEGKPITGQWVRSDKYVKDFIAYTWQLQNSDGSMSTSWYEKAEDNGKMDRKIQTTGHMVEFLLTALPDDQLQSPQMLRSISFLVNTLYEERGHDWQVGPKGHSLRALAMYYRRVFARADPWRPVAVARNGTNRTR